MVEALKGQTKPVDEIILTVCCIEAIEDVQADIRLLDVHRDDWGQSKCDYGLRMATKDYVGFFAPDDEYEPNYIEKLSEHEGTDIIHCQFDSHLAGHMANPRPVIGSITRGSFLVKRSIAMRNGSYDDRSHAADGAFIEKLKRKGATDVVVAEFLYRHL